MSNKPMSVDSPVDDSDLEKLSKSLEQCGHNLSDAIMALRMIADRIQGPEPDAMASAPYPEPDPGTFGVLCHRTLSIERSIDDLRAQIERITKL